MHATIIYQFFNYYVANRMLYILLTVGNHLQFKSRGVP